MTLEERLLNKREITDEGCWLWTGQTKEKGYGAITFNGRKARVHRIAYELWVGEIPGGLMVLHRCDVRNCFNPEHLFVGTAKDNTHDMLAKGRGRGTHGPHGKLTEAKVREIKKRLAEGARQIDLAAEYEVSNVMIHFIAKGKAWAWVEVEEPQRKVVRVPR